MGFFEDKPKQGKTQPTPFDMKCATVLARAVVRARKQMRPIKRDAWAAAFTRLRGFGVDRAQIKRVLLWYAKHIGEPHLPQAYSAEGFRTKFPAIEAAMRRAVGKAAKPVEISDFAKKINKDLNMAIVGWPPHVTQEDVLYVIQATYETYVDFEERLRLLKNDPSATRPTAALCKWLWNFVQHDIDTMVGGYMEWLHHTVWRIPEWSGNLRNWVWRPTAKHYRATGRGWAADYNGDPNTWDALLEQLYAK